MCQWGGSQDRMIDQSDHHVHELRVLVRAPSWDRVPVRRVQKASTGQAIDTLVQAVTHTGVCLSGCLAGEGVAPVKFQTFPISK